jgi:integrase
LTTSNEIALATGTDLFALEPLVERARAYAAEATSSKTRDAYAADWRSFAAWCAQAGLPSLPAPPATVAVYLAHLADAGRKVSTIERALAGIAYAHRTGGAEWSGSDPALRLVMSGIRRQLGTAPTKKAPVLGSDLLVLLATLGPDLRGVRDRALLTLGWFCAARRSETVALRVEDVEFTREGMIVHVARSKTDQEGQGRFKGVPFAGDPAACPVRALRAWLDAARIETGPIFRAVTRTGLVSEGALDDRAVARLVKRAAARAGLNAATLAGHSLRSGFITTAAKRGKSTRAIMDQSGHRSEAVMLGYIQHATVFDDNAAAGLL